MPKPNYPPDFGSTVRSIRTLARDAWTGAQSRTRYAIIRAAAIIIGQATGAQITIDPQPAGGGLPRIRLTRPDLAGHSDWAIFDGGSVAGTVLNAVEDSGNEGFLRVTHDTVSLWIRQSGDTAARVQADASQASISMYQGGEITQSVLVGGDFVRVGDTQNNDAAYALIQGNEARLRSRPPSQGAYTEIGVNDDEAQMVAVDSNGDFQALLAVQTDGDILHFGNWSPPL